MSATPLISQRIFKPTYTQLDTHSSSSMEIPEEERGSRSSSSNEGDDIHNDENFGGEANITEKPWKYKIVALICALSLAIGSHYAAHTLGALKTTVKKELKISNPQYGIIQSSVSLVNTILPIIGGIFIDTFGTSAGSILATSLITVGNIIVAVSTELASFPLMVVGRILYGIGSGTIVTIQIAILSHWFKGKGLAIVVGVQIAMARLAAFLANATVVPISEATKFYGWAFWFAAFLCVISFSINIIYVFLMRIIHESLSEQELNKLKEKRSFSPRKLLFLPTIYWIATLLEFTLGSSWTSFLHIHTELVKTRWNDSDKIAAFDSSVAQFLPIFVSPFLGYLLDRFGYRTFALITSTAFLCLSMYLLGFTLIFSPIIGMFCFSVSLSFGPVALFSSIPLLLPLEYIGTGLGIIKSTSNIGATLYDIFVGILQDKDKGQYGLVMRLYLVTGFAALLVSILLSISVKKWYHGVLDMKDDERNQYYEDKRKKDEPQLKEPSKRNWIYIIIFINTLILSWVLFFAYIINRPESGLQGSD
ncbi:hypothetical protein Glove_353g12 [Diversispora epigaea]|uniref:Lysosomal dipeptide transporter MFSD1 n=1 Tax=Diversispora epigaea TaxID=1348612 RepID=A0A397HBD5_9GLOM|nr:hypothetical protein Glove_353g12 [Diversispora epigaea]